MATSRSRTRKTAGSNIGRRVRDAFETAQDEAQRSLGPSGETTWTGTTSIVERQLAAKPKKAARRGKRKAAAAPRRAPAKRSKTAG